VCVFVCVCVCVLARVCMHACVSFVGRVCRRDVKARGCVQSVCICCKF